MDAGKLDQRIRIEAPAAGQDAAGQPTLGWQTVDELWARIMLQSGGEALKAGADTSTVKAVVRIRNRGGIDADMRVLHGATVYQITAVPPYVPRRDYLDLVCEVRT